MQRRENRYEQVDPRRVVEYHDPSEFDRIAFAMRVLQRLPTRRMTVAVYSSISALRIEQGRDRRHNGDAAWAIVGIPPHASREHIAYALAELAGITSVPYVVRALLADSATSDG